jgi:hypothetical protein
MANKSREYIKTLTRDQRRALGKGICSEGTLYQYAIGLRTPSMKVLAALEKATKGKIKAKDFFEEMKGNLG